MGRIKSILAGFMSIVLMIGLIANINIVNARAEGEGTQQVSFTLSIGMNEGSQAPPNYGISYTIMEDNGTTPAVDNNSQLIRGSVAGNSTGISSQVFSITIPSNSKIKVEITSAGNDIIMNGNDVTNDWPNGSKVYNISQISGETIAVQLRNNNNNNNPGGNQGGGNQTARIEFQDAVKVENQDAVTYTLEGNTYTVEVTLPNEARWNISDNHLEIENIPEGQPMTFTLSGDALGNSQIAKPKLQIGTETMEFNADNQISKVFSTTSNPIMINLVSGDNNNQSGGQNQGDQGGQGNQGPANQANVDLTVSWTGSFGEIKVGGSNGTGVTLANNSQHFGRVNITSDDKIEIILQAEPTIVFSSIKVAVNDQAAVEKLSSGQELETYSFTIPKDTTSLNIEAVTKQSSTYTIQWAYDNTFGPDALVEHGKVVMVSGAKKGDNTYWHADAGSNITVKLIPDYGYQVVGAKINDVVDLTAATNTNEFTFVMPRTHIHFRGIFTPTADVVTNTSNVAKKASISNGAAVAGDGGTAKLSVSNATPATQANTIVKEEIDTTKAIKAVNIDVSQIFYKNSADSYWENTKSELATPAQINLEVDSSAVDYAVVRTHGSEVTEIASSYNKATGTLTFASDKFSTYTLVPLTVSDEPVEESKPQSKPAEASGASRADEQFEQQVRTEELLDIQIIKADKTQVEATADAFVPDKSYNMSAYKTARGFITGLNKIAKNNRGAKSVSIYTGNPICFNKEIINAITKNKIDVVYYFMHKGHLYSVTIPAGTDLNRVLERNGFAGPLYIGKVLGTSRLIK